METDHEKELRASSARFCLRLATKYFNTVVNVASVEPQSWVQSTKDITEEAKKAAAILCFVDSPDRWEICKSFLTQVSNTYSDSDGENEESCGPGGEQIVLLLSTCEESSDEFNTYIQWAADHGVEFIRVSEDGKVNWDHKASLLEETEGWDRVTEALLTAPWPVINRKTENKRNLYLVCSTIIQNITSVQKTGRMKKKQPEQWILSLG